MKFVRLTRFPIVIISMFALTACAVGSDAVRPVMELPTSYKENVGWKVAEPRDQASRGHWWEIFGIPELNALEQRVMVSNQNLRAAEASYRQAQAAVQATRASYFPTLSANTTATRSQSLPSAGGGLSNQYALNVVASWEADIWGKIQHSVAASTASAQASAADLEAARLSLTATLAQNYFQLRALDTQKQLFEATIAAYRKSLKLTQNRYAVGVAAKVDVVQAQTQLESTQAQALQINVQRAQLEHAIALLVGQPPETFSLSPASLVATVPVTPVGLPSDLLERRPDIAAAERRVAAANAQIGVAEAAFFPALTLSGTGGLQNGNFAQWLSSPNLFWSVGPVLAQVIFDGGLRQAQTEEARALYDQNVALYRQAVLAGLQEVEDSLAALRYLEAAAQVQEAAVQSARQSVALTTHQYRAGVVSYLSVVQVQVSALANEQNAVNLLNSRLAASVLLIKALGGGWSSSSTLPPPR